ncbi:hypothetical protein JW592_13060 [Streptomyces sp. DW4-2]|uniref:Esterase family protein n=2 Tax=Streptomyces spirodelae TaxID=2812904 RepID=A0ABS3WTL6_9ACTN|nr:hypothetical protein [Streptomyces spirodelae]
MAALGAAAAVPALAVPTRASAASPMGARVVEERRVGPRLLDLTVESPAMGGRAFVRLLTPVGWERRRPGDRWPALWLLVGGDGDHKGWTESYDFHKGVARAALRDVLVVMPGMPEFGFYTDWWNGGKGGPPAVETFHLDEVLPLLEQDYGAGRRRVAAGDSQGGAGGLFYAARRPGLFRAVASFSGYIHPLQHVRAIRAGMTYLGLDWRALWGDPVAQRANWEAHDVYHLAERLRGVPVHLSSGDGRRGVLDPPGAEPDPHVPGLEDPSDPFPEEVLSPSEALMNEEARAVAPRLAQAGVQVSTHFYTGMHEPAYWVRELHDRLPWLLWHLRA